MIIIKKIKIRIIKNITTYTQNHTFLGDLCKKNSYILVAKTNSVTSIQNLTLGDYTQTLGVYPELPNNSLNIIKTNIVATNKDNPNYKFSLNYDLSLLCVDDEVTQISDIQTVFVDEFPTSITWSIEPYYQDKFVFLELTHYQYYYPLFLHHKWSQQIATLLKHLGLNCL